MSKNTFLKRLKYELRKLKKEERNRYVEYYDEIISDIVEQGATVEEAVARQGNIKKIAEDILCGTNPENLRNRDWRGVSLAVSSLILLIGCVVSLMLKMQFGMNMSTSVSVIGGADGPTSVFVAGKIGEPWGVYIATAVVLIVTIVYFVKKYRR